MQPIEVLTELRKNFSTTKAQRIIPILSRDVLLWNALQDDAYFRKLVAFSGDDPEKWSPAIMALVALVKNPQQGQSVSDMVDLALKSSGEALRLFDETRQIVRQPKNIVEAGYLALAMYARFVKNNMTRTLLQEIMPLPGEAERPALYIWQTPLAILIGLVDDPVEILHSLMPKRISVLVQQWVCNAIYSNPFGNERKVEIYSALFTGLPPAQQLSWMRNVHIIEDKDLVADIARQLLTKTSISSAQLLGKTNLDMIDIETAIVRCLEMQRLAGLYRFANQPANARAMLQKAQSIVQHWMAGLGVQDADLLTQEGQAGAGLAALQNAMALGGGSNGMQSEILLSVQETEQAEKLVEQLSDQTTNPISQIFLASRIARTGESEFAREMANRAVELWLQQASRQTVAFSSQFAIGMHPISLVQALVGMHLLQQAISVAVKLNEIQPSDAAMNLLISHIFDELGNTRQSLVYGQVAAAVAPDDADTHAWLATLWGKLGAWESSFQEQHQAIFLKQQPLPEDWVTLARCAVMLKNWDRVEEACDQALGLNPDQGSALAMKGQAFLETGKLEEAGKLLSRGTMLAPEEADAWLQLARLYHRTNNDQRALETLRAAVLAVPASAEINFALGRSYLDNGQTSEALPFLRKAASLDQNSIDIAVDLGETLTILGHIDEALQLIEQARIQWPQHPKLAFTHAQAALSIGNRETALKALETALEADHPEHDWYLMFARTILGKDLYRPVISKSDYAWLLKAEQSLEHALALQPEQYETKLLLAEVVQRKGNYEQAFDMFERLMDYPEFHSVEYRWRVQAGLGQVSLHLKQYDSALASLQEAVQDQPENLYLQHLLAESYLLSQLEKQALNTARFALRLMPDDLENLTWFADIMARLGELMEAIQALRTATQLVPESPNLWLKLAEYNLKLEDAGTARDNLQKLMALKRLDPETLHQAAKIFLCMGDLNNVLECLVKIDNPDIGVQMEIAYFSLQTKKLETGLKAIQEAAQMNANETGIYLVEADILTQLNRSDAALACLEHALHLFENAGKETSEDLKLHWEEAAERGLVPDEWFNGIQTAEAIHDHLSRLFRQMGDLVSAVHHAEQALDMRPEDNELRLQAAELSEALMQNERMEKILNGMQAVETTNDNPLSDENASWVVQMLAMQAEIALDKGDQNLARNLVENSLQYSISHSRLQAVQARLSGIDGNWADAAHFLEASAQTPGVWYGKAAVELFEWDKGLSVLEMICNQYPADIHAQFCLARGLAKAAFTRKTGSMLKLSARLPGEHVSNPKAQGQFERASSAAIKSGQSSAEHLQVIGRAIYQPGLQTIRSLAGILPGEAEAAALVASLREITNYPGAIQVAEQYQDSPEVLFQTALCLMAQDSPHTVETAQKAVELQPNQPLFLALLAKANQTSGLVLEALEALDEALQMWPDEPEWHIWASQLAEESGLEDEVVEHWDHVLKLVPMNNEQAVAAGKAYLDHHQEHKAILVLEEAAKNDPALIDAWYLLGKAYTQVGQFKMALVSGEKAAKLEPRSVEPALLCGEVALKMGHADEALQWGQKAVSLNGKNPDAALFVVNVFIQRNNLQEAFSIIEKSIQQNVSSKELLLKRAWLIYQLNGVQQALPELVSLNAAYPDQPSILKLLAQAEMESGDLTQAEQIAAQALNLDPVQPSLNLLMGKLQRLAGQLDQSIHYLSESIRQDPNKVDAYLELGKAYLDRREPAQALQVYQKAMKSVPKDHRPFYHSGLILREGKDYRGAETMLRRAAELAPDDLNIRRQLGAVITLNLIHSSQEASSSNESQHASLY